jgi:CheY-like chemotaxis protein
MNGQHATVLVVEDDAASRSLLVDLLTDAGYSVRGADSGRARARLGPRGHRPDLVLLDVQLPDVSDYSICPRGRRS